jgi:hypothetical protein
MNDFAILRFDVLCRTVRTLIQTLNLLYHLVFASDPTFNLRHKLLQAAQLRPFNGLTHMFIVTLGRLSYADCPDWLGSNSKVDLEQAAGNVLVSTHVQADTTVPSETARELLDLVVEGPELDSVWAAYQPADGDGSITDDEEMEARFLEANEI